MNGDESDEGASPGILGRVLGILSMIMLGTLQIPGYPGTRLSDACATLSPFVPCVMHLFGNSASATASGTPHQRSTAYSFIDNLFLKPTSMPIKIKVTVKTPIHVHLNPTVRQVNPQYAQMPQSSFPLNHTQGSVVTSTVKSKNPPCFWPTLLRARRIQSLNFVACACSVTCTPSGVVGSVCHNRTMNTPLLHAAQRASPSGYRAIEASHHHPFNKKESMVP